MYNLFAVCTLGLEPFTSRELNDLGLSPTRPSVSTIKTDIKEEAGGMEFQGSLRDIYRTNLHLRTASRVLVRLGAFNATLFPQLRRKASRLPWEQYLSPGKAVALRVTCHASGLYHQRAVAERVVGAIADRLGHSPPLDKFNEDGDTDFPQLVLVRLVDDQCTISVDSSGALLHRRGYRLETAKAPLRETLAAGMLLASGWDGTTPLLDPFCGSGTIPIEAALLARQISPGRMRRFAFMGWPNYDERLWKTLLADADQTRIFPLPRIMASDRDAGAIRVARANAERAGVAENIEFSYRSISGMDPPAGEGWVVTNPPYGVRVSTNRDLRNLYAQFGTVLRTKCSGWQVTILCGSTQLLQSTRLNFGNRIPLMNGGLKVSLVTGRVE